MKDERGRDGVVVVVGNVGSGVEKRVCTSCSQARPRRPKSIVFLLHPLLVTPTCSLSLFASCLRPASSPVRPLRWHSG